MNKKREHQHENENIDTATVREVVFGMEDGMVSTLGSITGIATGTGDIFVVILSGFVIISVESISMGVGSYLSSKSEREVEERLLNEERQKLKDYPDIEKEELVEMYKEDGWSNDLSVKMAEEASQNEDLMLKEMAFRELDLIPGKLEHPIRNGIFMWGSYIIGGLIPVSAYLFLPLETALFVSVGVTLVSLFALGAATTKFTKRKWWKAGWEMLALAAAAAAIGYGVGEAADAFLLNN